MKILIVKMSSMVDVIHTLPAITDLKKSLPDAQIDWVVEEAFVDIVASHPAINQVIPIAIRRWRQSWIRSAREVVRFVQEASDRRRISCSVFCLSQGRA